MIDKELMWQRSSNSWMIESPSLCLTSVVRLHRQTWILMQAAPDQEQLGAAKAMAKPVVAKAVPKRGVEGSVSARSQPLARSARMEPPSQRASSSSSGGSNKSSRSSSSSSSSSSSRRFCVGDAMTVHDADAHAFAQTVSLLVG